MNRRRLSRKKVLVNLAMLTVVVFVGAGVYAFFAPTLRLTAFVVKESFQTGEPVDIYIVLQNVGLWPMEFACDYQLLYYDVYDEAGIKIWEGPRWGLRLLWGMVRVYLLPTQTKTENCSWPQVGYREGDYCQVPKGTYTIVAWTLFSYQRLGYFLRAQPIKIVIE